MQAFLAATSCRTRVLTLSLVVAGLLSIQGVNARPPVAAQQGATQEDSVLRDISLWIGHLHVELHGGKNPGFARDLGLLNADSKRLYGVLYGPDAAAKTFTARGLEVGDLEVVVSGMMTKLYGTGWSKDSRFQSVRP
jgi:hypothetical protein